MDAWDSASQIPKGVTLELQLFATAASSMMLTCEGASIKGRMATNWLMSCA